MTIETKYNIGDEVWLMYGDRIKETKDYCHSLVVLMYNNQHLNIGCEEYLDGKLIYKYKEKTEV